MRRLKERRALCLAAVLLLAGCAGAADDEGPNVLPPTSVAGSTGTGGPGAGTGGTPTPTAGTTGAGGSTSQPGTGGAGAAGIAGKGGTPGTGGVPGATGGIGGMGPRGGAGGSTVTPPTGFGPVKYEAETGTPGGGARVLSTGAGFTGTGFIDSATQTRNGYVDIAVETPGGMLEIDVRYYTYPQSTQQHSVTLSVGNRVLGMANLNPTGNAWLTVTIAVNLMAGKQTIRVQLPQGGVDIDWITIKSPGSTTNPPPADAGTPKPPQDAGVSPQPADTNPPPVTVCDGAARLVQKCGNSVCHGGVTSPKISNSASLFTTLTTTKGKVARCNGADYSANVMINPSKPSTGVLYGTLNGDCSPSMPQGGTFSPDDLACVKEWAEAQAKK